MRIKKFNGGAGAILCSSCRITIKEGFASSEFAMAVHKRRGTLQMAISDEDWESDEPLFCEKCIKKDKNGISQEI